MNPKHLALVCDYLRSRKNPDSYINDEVGIPQVGMTPELAASTARAWLDIAEAMNFAALGEMFCEQLVRAYLPNAQAWKEDQAAAERVYQRRRGSGDRDESTGILIRGEI